jgi:DNA/RNA-binding domain of Phe-tRNA-synthetase-like protein
MIDQVIKLKFPDLDVRFKKVEGLTVKNTSSSLEEFKSEIIEEIKNNYDLETLKDDPQIRKYRDFFWKIDIDPTKTRPASEALIRRILQGKPIPTINTAVDAYNLASIKSGVPLAAFDARKLKGELYMRVAMPGEGFQGIGMEKPKILKGGEIVVEDEGNLVAIYPYRDADESKVTLETAEILLMSCGVPGIEYIKLEEAVNLAAGYLVEYCGG